MEAEKYIPPWESPYIIGIAGLSGSGKTTVAQNIINSINEPWTILLSLDNFYKELTPEQSHLAFLNEYDLDKPSSIDLDLVYECVRSIKQGKKTEIPVYSFAKHKRLPDENLTIYGANVVIIEGIYALFKPELLSLMDCKVFVDTDLDLCYSRRLLRDIVHRGRDIQGVIKQWDLFVKPNATSYVLPTRSNADVVIPRGSDNTVAMELLIQHLKKQLDVKSINHINHLKSLGKGLKPINWKNVHILNFNNQLRAIKTMILNKNTSNDDFIFSFNRISTILISEALDLMDYISGKEALKSVTTPINYTLDPNSTYFLNQEIIAVSVIRSGDCFIRSLRRTIPAAKIGKILIQTDSRTGEPKLHTEKLPQLSKSHNSCKILLFDSQIISGAASIMAIKVLIDHDIKQNQIVLVTYTATESGIRRILNTFPDIQLVVSCIGKRSINSKLDDSVDESNNIDINLDSDWWMATRFIDNKYFGTS
ncbi:Uridine kinase [Pichia californica]|uniref:Uridine kinase n=1 Tax=Pichia californica TaxID=460514 RepID=A0A9P6WL09_9ASCO|nr:Uridine kinase [[Candida] californica]KAG0688859.1 Uridine kinase [[Candida] californica]